MLNQKGSFSLVTVFILILLVGFGGYYLGSQNSQKVIKDSSKVSTVNSPSPVSYLDNKTYKYDFDSKPGKVLVRININKDEELCNKPKGCGMAPQIVFIELGSMNNMAVFKEGSRNFMAQKIDLGSQTSVIFNDIPPGHYIVRFWFDNNTVFEKKTPVDVTSEKESVVEIEKHISYSRGT